MRRMSILAIVATIALVGAYAMAEDPFAGGIDALAVTETDGSTSLRAKKKLKKIAPDMFMVRVKGIDDKRYPDCVMTAQVMKAPRTKSGVGKLVGRGKVYRFRPILKKKNGVVDLSDDLTQNNLGACYYQKGTTLILKVGTVNRQDKTFEVAELYPK